jgi:hypothetical protein
MKAIGPVAAVSFRVASRIVNTLGAGIPVRSAADLDSVRVILFHSPPDQFPALAESLLAAPIRWAGKSLIFCDCQCSEEYAGRFRALGVRHAGIRHCAIPSRLIVNGDGPAMLVAHRLARDLGMKTIELTAATTPAFETALTLASGAITPLIDQSAGLLRQCGLRDTEASRVAAGLFEQTAREYGRSGRQSWTWYQRPPNAALLWAQLGAAGTRMRRIIGEAILFGLEEHGRHEDAARALRQSLSAAEPKDPGGSR